MVNLSKWMHRSTCFPQPDSGNRLHFLHSWGCYFSTWQIDTAMTTQELDRLVGTLMAPVGIASRSKIILRSCWYILQHLCSMLPAHISGDLQSSFVGFIVLSPNPSSGLHPSLRRPVRSADVFSVICLPSAPIPLVEFCFWVDKWHLCGTLLPGDVA